MRIPRQSLNGHSVHQVIKDEPTKHPLKIRLRALAILEHKHPETASTDLAETLDIGFCSHCGDWDDIQHLEANSGHCGCDGTELDYEDCSQQRDQPSKDLDSHAAAVGA